MLKLSNIQKAFGRHQVLKGINLSVEPGQILGLLGPNGSGKSTILRIIAGYYTQDHGALFINGDSYDSSNANTRRLIGYLPERPPLYDNLTVKQYLHFVSAAKGIKAPHISSCVTQAAQDCQLTHVLAQPIIQLSKGYRQRVGLAQTILSDPQILLLDEPTNGLDPVQIIETRKMIQQQAQHRAVIYSSHIISEIAALCHRVVILYDGKLSEVQKPVGITNHVKHFEIKFKTTDVAAIEEKITSLSSVTNIKIVADNIHQQDELTLTCQLILDDTIVSMITQIILAHGTLYSLKPIDDDLEQLFIQQIQEMKQHMEQSS